MQAIAASSDRRSFVLRKLHSLTGVAPVGLFLLVHLWTNASALGGERRFNAAVEQIARLPFLPAIELSFIFLPLSFHAVYGIWLSRAARLNVAAYPHGRNWAYVMQRVTGVVTFVFVLAHLWQLWAQKQFFGLSHQSFFTVLTRDLSDVRMGAPWLAIFYMLGVAASVYHFANGLIGFCLTWGIVTTRRAQRRVTVFATLFGSALFLLGGATVLFFATGTKPYLPGESPTHAAPDCTPSSGGSAPKTSAPPSHSR